MSYKLVEGGIRRLSDRAYISFDEDNIDYQKYLEWVAEGNTPEPQYTQGELDIKEALDTKLANIKNIIDTNLPSYSQVQTAIDNIGNLDEAKVFLKKLAAVIYVYIKNNDK